ncbi:MAG TPA: hypothetical protein VFC37_21780, partial [Terracidiphilus sp.]|nr:hypothetical protein [Terracidiphilus sp.]
MFLRFQVRQKSIERFFLLASQTLAGSRAHATVLQPGGAQMQGIFRWLREAQYLEQTLQHSGHHHRIHVLEVSWS